MRTLKQGVNRDELLFFMTYSEIEAFCLILAKNICNNHKITWEHNELFHIHLWTVSKARSFESLYLYIQTVIQNEQREKRCQKNI